MALQTYKSSDVQIWYKVIRGKPHSRFRKSEDKLYDLGIAFRTASEPVGYFPFYGPKDFNMNGETSLIEKAASKLPIDFSGIASPHTILVEEAAADFQFTGTGSEDLTDIQKAMAIDKINVALRLAGGIFIDGVMMSLGGPTIKTLIKQCLKSEIKQFIISTTISGAVKSHIKNQSNFDVDKLLEATK